MRLGLLGPACFWQQSVYDLFKTHCMQTQGLRDLQERGCQLPGAVRRTEAGLPGPAD